MRISDWSSDVCSSDLGLEVVGAQIVEQLDHRLKDHSGIEVAGGRVLGLGDPVMYFRGEGLDRHPGVGGVDDLDQRFFAAGHDGLHVAGRGGLQRRGRCPAGIGGRQLLRLVAREEKLEVDRTEAHTSELQSLMRISYAVFCLKTKKT